MSDRFDEPGGWLAGGRYYRMTTCDGPECTSWELEDVAPAPGRGVLFAAMHDDDSREVTFEGWAAKNEDSRVPFEVIDAFCGRVRQDVLSLRLTLDRMHGDG